MHVRIKDFLVERQRGLRVNSKLSSWGTVLNGVPQSTVKVPVLFFLYANGLPSILSPLIMLYADDVKIWGAIKCKGDFLELQNELEKSECSRTWHLPMNASKLTMMHIGHHVANIYIYIYCRVTAVKSFRTLWPICRPSRDVSTENVSTLYTVFVRPKLEYYIQAASPSLTRDNELLKVQKSATRLSTRIAKLPHGARLTKLQLFLLSYRWTRGDLIKFFKLLSDKFVSDSP